jgi:hypothetical protein
VSIGADLSWVIHVSAESGYPPGARFDGATLTRQLKLLAPAKTQVAVTQVLAHGRHNSLPTPLAQVSRWKASSPNQPPKT